mgnify:FL=1
MSGHMSRQVDPYCCEGAMHPQCSKAQRVQGGSCAKCATVCASLQRRVVRLATLSGGYVSSVAYVRWGQVNTCYGALNHHFFVKLQIVLCGHVVPG